MATFAANFTGAAHGGGKQESLARLENIDEGGWRGAIEAYEEKKASLFDLYDVDAVLLDADVVAGLSSLLLLLLLLLVVLKWAEESVCGLLDELDGAVEVVDAEDALCQVQDAFTAVIAV
jgi:hypothetical protein